MKRLDIHPYHEGTRSPARSERLADWLLAEVRVERAMDDPRVSDLTLVFYVGLAAVALRRTLDDRKN